MKSLTSSAPRLHPGLLLTQMSRAAALRFGSDAAWARAAGLPKETLSRLKTAASCDLRTLAALAQAIGYTLTATPAQHAFGDAGPSGHMPERFDRRFEQMLLDLITSGDLDPGAWLDASPLQASRFLPMLEQARA